MLDETKRRKIIFSCIIKMYFVTKKPNSLYILNLLRELGVRLKLATVVDLLSILA